MLPFDLSWLEPISRRSFRDRFDNSKRIICSALIGMSKSRIISISWLAPYRARFFLANGTFVALDFHGNSAQPLGIVSSAVHDRFLLEHLESAFHEASDALLTADFALLVSGTTNQNSAATDAAQIATEQSDHNLYFVYFGRRHVGSGCEQLSQLDPHVQTLPLSSSGGVQHMKRDRRFSNLTAKPGKTDRLRLVMNSSKDLFAVWWSCISINDSANSDNLAGEDSAYSASRSGGAMLFRLDAASCCLNPLAALQPAPLNQFMLLSFSNTAACEMFAIEWCRKEQYQTYYVVIVTTTYLIDQDELVRLDSSALSILDKNRQLTPSLAALSPRDDRLLITMHNGCLFMVNVRSSVVAASSTRFSVGIASIAWHPTGSLFAVIDVTGKLFLLDLGLSVLQLFQLRGASMGDPSAITQFVSLGEFDVQMKTMLSPPLLSWNPDGKGDAHAIDKIDRHLGQSSIGKGGNPGLLVIAWAGLKGLGLFRLKLPHPPTSSYLIRHWLSLSRSATTSSNTKRDSKHRSDPALTAAVAIVSAMDFDIDGEQAVRCVLSTATALLRQRPMDALIDALLDKCLACFCNPVAPISEVTKLEFGPAISQILRRRALHLLRHGKLETAFDVSANQLPQPATDLLADTFYAALERGELALAKAAYARARRQVAAASATIEIPGPDGNQKDDDDDDDQHSI